MEYEIWTEKLRALRESRDWRQQDVADRVPFSRSQYCAIENGKCVANYVHLYNLAKAFDLHLPELLAMVGVERSTKQKRKRIN